MTIPDIARIKAYCEKATEGPWIAGPCDPEAFIEFAVVESEIYDAVEIYAPRDRYDDTPADISAFIAQSREDLPACVAWIEAVVNDLQLQAAVANGLCSHLQLNDMLRKFGIPLPEAKE